MKSELVRMPVVNRSGSAPAITHRPLFQDESKLFLFRNREAPSIQWIGAPSRTVMAATRIPPWTGGQAGFSSSCEYATETAGRREARHAG